MKKLFLRIIKRWERWKRDRRIDTVLTVWDNTDIEEWERELDREERVKW